MSRESLLGRTIEDLFEENKQEFKDSEEIEMIELSSILPNPDQPRTKFDKEALNELATSIREHGVIQPIILKKGVNNQYILVAGERRVKASIIAGLKKIPAIIREYNSNVLSEIAMLENIQREDLTPIEEAIAFQHTINKLNLTHEQLSKKIGKSRSYVTNSIGLLHLPKVILDAMNKEKISMGHARVLSKIKDTKSQSDFFTRIIKEELTVRELELLVRENNRKREGYIITKDEMKLVENKLSLVYPKGMKYQVKKNRIEFSFSTKQELDSLLEYILKGDNNE
jgi:ParB family chromosome partitioning protein